MVDSFSFLCYYIYNQIPQGGQAMFAKIKKSILKGFILMGSHFEGKIDRQDSNE